MAEDRATTSSVTDLCSRHNEGLSQRASLQQKLFVLDYIKSNHCSISKAVMHFITTGCNFKISVSTVSDWKHKEDALRGIAAHSSGIDQNKLTRRTKLKFRYPLIVEKLEAMAKAHIQKGHAINETILISMWRQAAGQFKNEYSLSDSEIKRGPSKGFIYRFKARNGIASHERKIREELSNELEELNKINDTRMEKSIRSARAPIPVPALTPEPETELVRPSLPLPPPPPPILALSIRTPPAPPAIMPQPNRVTTIHQDSSDLRTSFRTQTHGNNNSNIHTITEVEDSIMKISNHLLQYRQLLPLSGQAFDQFIGIYRDEKIGHLQGH